MHSKFIMVVISMSGTSNQYTHKLSPTQNPGVLRVYFFQWTGDMFSATWQRRIGKMHWPADINNGITITNAIQKHTAQIRLVSGGTSLDNDCSKDLIEENEFTRKEMITIRLDSITTH